MEQGGWAAISDGVSVIVITTRRREMKGLHGVDLASPWPLLAQTREEN